MDPADMNAYYQAWFTVRETTALNENFEVMDIGNKNFLQNTGSFFFFVIIIIVLNIV